MKEVLLVLLVAQLCVAQQNFPAGMADYFQRGFSMHKVDLPLSRRLSLSNPFLFEAGFSTFTDKSNTIRQVPSNIALTGFDACNDISTEDSSASSSMTTVLDQMNKTHSVGFDAKFDLSFKIEDVGVKTSVSLGATHGSSSSSRFFQSKSIDHVMQGVELQAQAIDYTAEWIRPPTKSLLSAQFVDDVLDLEDSYSDEKADFLMDLYGTHYIRKADMGATMSAMMVFAENARATDVQNSMMHEKTSGFSFLWFSSSTTELHVHATDDMENSMADYTRSSIFLEGAAASDDFSSFCAAFNTNPVPISFDLAEISDLFSLSGASQSTIDAFDSRAANRIVDNLEASDLPSCLYEDCPDDNQVCGGAGCAETRFLPATLTQGGKQSAKFQTGGEALTVDPIIALFCSGSNCGTNSVLTATEASWRDMLVDLEVLDDATLTNIFTSETRLGQPTSGSCELGKVATSYICLDSIANCGAGQLECRTPTGDWFIDPSDQMKPPDFYDGSNPPMGQCDPGYVMTGFRCSGYAGNDCSGRIITCSRVIIVANLDEEPGNGISIVNALFGFNCDEFSVPVIDLANACNDKEFCQYKISTDNIADPDPDCSKDFEATYTCGGDKTVRSATVAAPANDKTIILECLDPLSKCEADMTGASGGEKFLGGTVKSCLDETCCRELCLAHPDCLIYSWNEAVGCNLFTADDTPRTLTDWTYCILDTDAVASASVSGTRTWVYVVVISAILVVGVISFAVYYTKKRKNTSANDFQQLNTEMTVP